MKLRIIDLFFLAIFFLIYPPSECFADRDNTLSGSILLGDAYAMNHYRLSIGQVDIGVSNTLELYAGSRAWLDHYYAGFGLGIRPGMYGFVGYEWKFFPLMGMTFEFDGTMSLTGEAFGRVYIGLVVGG